jgi:hypothetical protein
MGEAFGSDALVGMITDAGPNREARERLIMVCTAILVEINRTKASLDFPKLHEAVIQEVDGQEMFVKAVLAMLVAMPGFMGTKITDVIALTQYKGNCPLHSSLKHMLVSEAANYWKKKFDELTFVAGSEREFQPLLVNHIQRLQKCVQDAESVCSTLGNITVLLEPVSQVLADYPRLSDAMRTGALEELDLHLSTLCPQIAQAILNTDSFDKVASVGPIEVFIANLEVVASTAEMQELILKLDTWRIDMSAKLSRKHFDAFLATNMKADDGLSANIFDLGELKEHFTKNTELSEQTKHQICDLLPTILRKLVEKVGFG